MSFEVRALRGEETHDVPCPACGTCLARASATGMVVPSGRPYLHDGDVLPVVGELPPAETERREWSAALTIGRCPTCSGALYAVEVVMGAMPILGPDGDAWHDRAMSRHEPRHVVVTDGTATWLSARYDTRRGGFVHHDLGPFLERGERDWVGPFGVSACQVGEGPWEEAIAFVATRWAGLRAATAAILAEPGPVRPRAIAG